MFIVNQLYPRDDLKSFIGTNDMQSGILYPTGAKPNATEYVVLASGGKHGEKVGYQDEKLADGKWVYFGQGGEGDQDPMRMANKMLLEETSQKLLFSTRQPTRSEINTRGHERKLYRFEGVFRLESWSIFIPSEGVRAGNKIIRTVLTPLSDIPHITETIDVSIEEKDSVLDEDYSWSKDELEELSKLSKAELLKRAKAWAPSYTASHVNALRRTRKEDTRQKKIVALIEDHTCQVCGFFCEYKNLKGRRRFLIHIDHIEEKNKKGDERLENLWALCPNCHAKKTAGIIKIDLKKKKVFDNETEIAIRDSHLFL